MAPHPTVTQTNPPTDLVDRLIAAVTHDLTIPVDPATGLRPGELLTGLIPGRSPYDRIDVDTLRAARAVLGVTETTPYDAGGLGDDVNRAVNPPALRCRLRRWGYQKAAA